MIDFIVVGKSKIVVLAVLLAIRSFSKGKCVVIGDEETTMLRWSTLCKQQITLSFDGKSDQAFADTVQSLCAQAPYATLIPADCEGIRIVNRMREHMPERITPMPDLETLNMFDDKWRFHEFCARHDLPVPVQRLFRDKSSLRFNALVAEFGLPFVLKPVNQAGSLGVLVIHSRVQYEQMVAAEGQYPYAPIIAQQFIAGDDVDISLLSMHGRLSAFAIQQVQGPQIQFLANPQLEAIAERLCAASRFHGVMHIDTRRERHSGRMYLIESNPRFWATLPASVWCGLNFIAESMKESARPAGPLRLTAGSASTRHPLMRPSAWADLVFDGGEQGRLLRAMTFDLPSIGNLVRELPRRILTYRQRRTAAVPAGLIAARGDGLNG
jgi:predicted ATP-grasp superfamily ATP-dependent carboligase